MAELLGVTPSYVSQILSGKKKGQSKTVLLLFERIEEEGPPEQKMQFHQLSPETLELMAGVQEVLDSGVETVVSALRASIQAFRLSSRALRREGDRKRAKGAAAMGGPE